MAGSGVPVIYVLSGVNGAGKSSIGGARLREDGLNYFNPDEAAGRIRRVIGCPAEEANALAWHEGVERLRSAIESRLSFAFETTLGGSTIPRLLIRAADQGLEVLVWFVGLSSVEQHIDRVRTRVAAGGHDIPEAKIRERWDSSRRNLVALMPKVTEVKVFDNSLERDPAGEAIPAPRLLLHFRRGVVIAPKPSVIAATPEWAMPILARALQIQRSRK